MRLSTKASKLLREFQVWSIKFAEKGSRPPEEFTDIDRSYTRARKAIRDYIMFLESTVQSTGEATERYREAPPGTLVRAEDFGEPSPSR